MHCILGGIVQILQVATSAGMFTVVIFIFFCAGKTTYLFNGASNLKENTVDAILVDC